MAKVLELAKAGVRDFRGRTGGLTKRQNQAKMVQELRAEREARKAQLKCVS